MYDNSNTWVRSTSAANCRHYGRSCGCNGTAAMVWSTQDSHSAPALTRRLVKELRRLEKGGKRSKEQLDHLDFVAAKDALARQQEHRRLRQLGTKPPRKRKVGGGRRYRNTKRGARPKNRS